MNPGGRGCSERRSCPCTPARAAEQDLVSKKVRGMSVEDGCHSNGVQSRSLLPSVRMCVAYAHCTPGPVLFFQFLRMPSLPVAHLPETPLRVPRAFSHSFSFQLKGPETSGKPLTPGFRCLHCRDYARLASYHSPCHLLL